MFNWLHDITATVKEQLDIKRKDVTAPLDFLNSRYRQDKYFNSHSLCIKPESVALGNTVSCSRGKSQIQHECFQHISVEGTLRSLLQSEDYVNLLLHDRYKADLLVDYTDGSFLSQLATVLKVDSLPEEIKDNIRGVCRYELHCLLQMWIFQFGFSWHNLDRP